MSVLADILESTRADIERRRRAAPEMSLRGASDRAPRAFRDALAAPGLSIVPEHKRRSPSAGAIRPGSSVTEVARAYERGGAAAISVLTEEQHFEGSLADLREAHAACRLPLLRQDFIVASYQAAEAASAGASAGLVIGAAPEPRRPPRLPPAVAAQGFHRRLLPARRSRLGGRLGGAADRRRTRARRARGAARGGPGARPRRAGRGARPRRARRGARRRGRDRWRQQPRPARLPSRHRTHLRAARGDAAGDDRRRRVGNLDTAAARSPARARRARRADRRTADA